MNFIPHLIFLLQLRIKGAFPKSVDTEMDTVVAQFGVPLTLKCPYNCTAWTRASWRHLKKSGAFFCTSCFQQTKKTIRNGSFCTELLSLKYKSLNQTRYEYTCDSVETDDPSLTPKTERKVLVLVQAAPSAPVVTVTPHDGVKAGQPMELKCTTEGFYPENITVTWAFNGSQVTGRTVKTKTNGTFSAQSQISAVPTDAYHRGVFTCEVHHLSLSHPLRADITLDVKYLSMRISCSDGAESTMEELSPLHTIISRVGDFLKLSCLVDSNPPTKGQWVRETVLPSRKTTVTATTVTLGKVQVEDAGNYSCVASTGFDSKRLTVTIEVNSGESTWFKVLAVTMVTVATVLGAVAVYFCLGSKRKRREHQALSTCNSGRTENEPRPEKTSATGKSAMKRELVTVTFTPADSQSDHEVPYADIMISVRGSSTPELTHIPEPTPWECMPRWKEERGSRGLLQLSCSADRLHVQQRDVTRKMSTSSEYAVIQYRSEPLG